MEKYASLPSLFIGSSSEGLKVAEYLQGALEGHCEATTWSQGVFGLSQGTLESLVTACKHFDFAALILTPDDMITKRGSRNKIARDNVLFELGLFMGSLGRDRTFIVYCRDEKIDLPSDLAGVTAATFPEREDGNMAAAIRPIAVRIREAIEKVRNSDNTQTSTRKMLMEFSNHNNVVNELKQGHHLLQDLAIPVEMLVIGFRTNPAWREKPLGTDTIKQIRIYWEAVLTRIHVVEYFARTITSSEIRSLFHPIRRLKKDFKATLDDSMSVQLYDLSLQLFQECQANLEIIDRLMLKQFYDIDRITKQILRSISDDPTQS